jgi:adenosylcobinamide-GDP ribazoletransferase
LADLALATVFLTRLRLAAPARGADALSAAMRMFPVVGAGIGLAGGLVFALAGALGLGPWVSAVLALAGMIVLTGALHEDALADVVDGFGGGHDRAAKLAIMRDSHIGTYGVLALALSLALRLAALATLGETELVAPVLIGAAAASRAAMPLVMHVLEAARPDGVGAGAGRPSRGTVIWALSLATVIVFAALDVGVALIAALLSALAAWAGIILAKRQIGGFTGDVVGAVGLTVEIVFVVACVGAI